MYKTDTKPKYTILETESDHPPAYARIKLHGSALKSWGDYINANGYLRRYYNARKYIYVLKFVFSYCRDKVQARLVELLAIAASKDVPNSPLHVDESVHCGIPGKVVDSYTLYNILKIDPVKHVYYGPGNKDGL